MVHTDSLIMKLNLSHFNHETESEGLYFPTLSSSLLLEGCGGTGTLLLCWGQGPLLTAGLSWAPLALGGLSF